MRSTFNVKRRNVKRRNENRRNIHELDEESVVVQVENSINSNSESIVTLSNIYLIGTLNIYDDSLLTMNEKSNFSEQSEINVIIQRSKSYSSNDKPIIYVGQSLNSKPKSIILSSGPNNDKIDITDMPIIGSETFNGCSKWDGVFKFQDGKNGDISISCKTNNNIETSRISIIPFNYFNLKLIPQYKNIQNYTNYSKLLHITIYKKNYFIYLYLYYLFVTQS